MVSARRDHTTTALDISPRPKRIALILVHGIGEQEEGDTVDKLRKGLLRTAKEGNPGLWIDDGEKLTFGFKDTSVRVYEVTWSKVLADLDYGAFDIQMLSNVVWFPLIDLWKKGRRFLRRPASLIVVGKTVVLSLAVGLVELGHWGLCAPLGAWKKIKLFRSDAGAVPWTEPTMENLVKAGLLPQRSFVSRLLDQYLGDVFAYTTSALALQRKPHSAEARPAQKILNHIDMAVQEALSLKEGCDEIHILAHSLGSVIAHDYLAGLDSVESRGPQQRIPVAAFYSIGSPLEKIRTFWPRLALEPGEGSVRAMGVRWLNFANPLDIVSSRIRHASPWARVRNRWVLQGGLIRSHTLYEQSSAFMAYLTLSLFGEKIRSRRHPLIFVWGVVKALAEAAALMIGTGFVMLLGLVVFAATFVVSFSGFWLYAQLLRIVGWDVLGTEIVRYNFWITLVLIGLVLVLRKIIAEPLDARERYLQLLGQAESVEPDDGPQP